MVMGAVQWNTLRFEVIQPRIYTPSFSVVAAAELVVPLALTMIAVQGAQSFAILRGLGYQTPPVNSITSASGAGTIIGAFFGTHAYCTAPVMVGIVGNPEEGALSVRGPDNPARSERHGVQPRAPARSVSSMHRP